MQHVKTGRRISFHLIICVRVFLDTWKRVLITSVGYYREYGKYKAVKLGGESHSPALQATRLYRPQHLPESSSEMKHLVSVTAWGHWLGIQHTSTLFFGCEFDIRQQLDKCRESDRRTSSGTGSLNWIGLHD